MPDMPADAIYETWDDIYQKCIKLARMVEAHCRQSGEKFDKLLVVPRGGYYPANIVARELGFPATDILHAGVSSYAVGKAEQSGFKTGHLPPKEQVAGKDILVIDEVCETGQTLQFIYDYLRENDAGLIRTAVVHYKSPAGQGGFKPDFIVETTDKWIVYPWEPHEERGLESQARRGKD